MPIWFIFALLSIASLVGSELSQKVSMSNKKDISAITNNFFVWTMQGSWGIVLALLLGEFAVPIGIPIYLKLLIIGIVYFIGGTLYYTSYKANSASLSIILGSISVVVSTLLGIVVFGEGTSLVKFLGILGVLLAIGIINYSKGLKLSKYNYYALGGGIAFGIAFTIDKSFVIATMHPAMYLGLFCYAVAIVSLVAGYKTIKSDAIGLVPRDFLPMISSAFFGALFNLFTFFAYTNGADVGKVDAMNNSVVFFVILFEILLFKDKTNLLKKVIAASIAVLSIWSFTW